MDEVHEYHFEAYSVDEALAHAVAQSCLYKRGRPTSALMGIESITALGLGLAAVQNERARWLDGCLSIWTPGGFLDVRPNIKQADHTATLFDSEGKTIGTIFLGV